MTGTINTPSGDDPLFSVEMQRALEADGEKLRQLTGEDHGPRFLAACESCGGEGGFEIATAPLSKWGDPTPGGEWVRCPECNGSGWIDCDPVPLDVIDLDERCGD